MPATRWRMRYASPPNTLPIGDQSALLPVGTLKNASGILANLILDQETAASSAAGTIATLAQTAHQDIFHARFISAPLAAQTIAAGNWIGVMRGNKSSNALTGAIAVSAYIWNRQFQTVRAYIYEGDTNALGINGEIGTSLSNNNVLFAGQSVTVGDGDVLVIETWLHATQSMATSYSYQISYSSGGATTDAVGGGTSGHPYFDSPSTIYYQGESAPQPPNPVQNFAAVGDTDSVNLSWTAPVASSPATTGFGVFRDGVMLNNGTALPATATSFEDTTAEAGFTYPYYIATYNGTGGEALSPSVEAGLVTGPPAHEGAGSLSGSGSLSALGESDQIPPITLVVPPDSAPSQAGITGIVDSIRDDPATPDGTMMDGSPGTAVDLRLGFDSPGGMMVSGAGLQKFRIRLRRSI